MTSQLKVDRISPATGSEIIIDGFESGGGGIVGVSVFTSAGTWTKATREAALGVTIKRINITVLGGGGGGGKGHQSAGYGATGGQAGGAAIKYLYDVSGISSATITVGSAGAGGTGTAGGTSSYTDGTLTISCPGGKQGGSYTSQQTSNGVPTGGDIIIEGALGYMDSVNYEGGAGGSSILSGGGPGTYNKVGNSATGYGGGGGGAGSVNGNGGAGSQGIVIIEEISG